MGALAADEVGITAVLNNAKITKSDAAQTVTLTIAPESPVTVCSVGLRVVLPEGWSVAAITNDDANMPITAGDINLGTNQVSWLSGDMEDYPFPSLPSTRLPFLPVRKLATMNSRLREWMWPKIIPPKR